MNRITRILSDYRDLEVNSLPQDDLLLMSEALKSDLQERNIPIFVVNGVSGGGKTTFENIVKNFALKDNKTVLVMSMAADAKEFCKECLGWDGIRDDKSRKLLADIISALTSYGEIPKLCIVSEIRERLFEDAPACIFIDAREISDIKWFEHHLGATSIIVKRKNNTANWTNHADREAQERYAYDLEIYNYDGLEELKATAENFYKNKVKGE